MTFEATLLCQATVSLDLCYAQRMVASARNLLTVNNSFLWHAPACSLVYEERYLSVKAVVISFVLVKTDIAKHEKQ